jgi:hypothetical protein
MNYNPGTREIKRCRTDGSPERQCGNSAGKNRDWSGDEEEGK